jgi:hypothetical protein
MKTKIAAALLVVAAMLTSACEKHDWKTETSQLFKSHGDHGGAQGKPGDHPTHPEGDAKKPH